MDANNIKLNEQHTPHTETPYNDTTSYTSAENMQLQNREDLFPRLLLGIGRFFMILNYMLKSLFNKIFENKGSYTLIKLGVLFFIGWWSLGKLQIMLPSLVQHHSIFGIVGDEVTATKAPEREGTFFNDGDKGHATFVNNTSNFSLGAVASNPLEMRIEKYLNRFYMVAVSEHKRFGIPASILMAQAMLESKCGINTPANNHFTARSNRQYKTAWESWRDHSIFLTNGAYIDFKRFGNDYTAWANALESANYIKGDTKYAEKLIQIIETYNLSKLDN